MKKFLIFLLLATLMLPLTACADDGEEIIAPVEFFYLRREPTYGTSDSVIAPENRESAGHEDDREYLLSMYLEGPASTDLYSLIPAGTRLLALQQHGERIKVILSDEFAQLNGLDRTLACACIAKTCMTLLRGSSVEIDCKTISLGEFGPIYLDAQSLLLLDDAGITPAQ